MGNIRLSLRYTLGITILLMGALAMGLALTTGKIYRDLALDSQRITFTDLIGLKVDDLLKDLDTHARDLGLALQSQTAFNAAILTGDVATLTQLMDMQFHQYFVTAEIIRLEKLRLLSLDLQSVLAQSTEGTSALDSTQALCPGLIKRAAGRSGAERLHTVSGLCQIAGHPHEIVIVPVGGLLPKAYLEVIVDPVQSLIPIESALGMPIRLTLPDHRSVYQSSTWPEHTHTGTMLLADFALTSDEHTHVLTVTVASDITDLYGKLINTRLLVIIVASLSALLAAFLVLAFLRTTTFRPLDVLTRQLRLVQHDRNQLGHVVKVSGATEIRELAHNFNEMTSELKDLYEALERMAFTDPLTRLPNRTRFHERLRDATAIAKRVRNPFTLLLMDLDRFKGVNDTLGHHVGDYLLQMVGMRLESVLRDGDALQRLDGDNIKEFDSHLVARLGGDEFAAILTNVDTDEGAVTVANKLLAIMEEPFIVEGHHFNIGMSIGIAHCPKDGSDMNMLMRHADVAMYNAKQTQRGYAFYNDKIDHHSLLNLTLEHDLRHAIEHDGLVLHYQPKFDAATGLICGAEALARWSHPQRGLIPPDQFIPLAERSGLIHPLTLLVLKNALNQCARWHRDGFRIGVAVNLSALNFRDPNIAQHVADALRDAGVEPTWLTLELTESTVMSNPDDALAVLTQLDAMGIRLAIDDFGTGYSSLSYLRRLPVDEIKIDKSFVFDMKDNANDAVIVTSTIDLAHNMGLIVVAEGVENDTVLKRLSALGCDMAQGYHLSHPLPGEQFVNLLHTTGQTQAALSVVDQAS